MKGRGDARCYLVFEVPWNNGPKKPCKHIHVHRQEETTFFLSHIRNLSNLNLPTNEQIAAISGLPVLTFPPLDSLLFRLQVPPPPPSTFLSISFVSTDRMFILDAPAPFVTSLLQTYSFRVQRSQTLAPGELEIKFHGTPWLASGKETVTARLLVVMLLEVLELHGFSLYASIDQDNGREGRGMDTWYCCRRVGWEVGDPVWHA